MKDTAQKFLRIMLPMVALNFERDGHVLPVAFLLTTKDADTGEMLAHPRLAIVPMPWGTTEERLCMLANLHELALRMGTVISLFVCEVWYAEAAENLLEVQAHLAQKGSLEGYPGCKERVSALLEYEDQAEVWNAEITRDPNTVKDFSQVPDAGIPCILNKGLDNATLTN
jgi:hypothetical protein